LRDATCLSNAIGKGSAATDAGICRINVEHIAISGHSLPQSRVGASFGQHGTSGDMVLAPSAITMPCSAMVVCRSPGIAIAGAATGARMSPRIANAESKSLIVDAVFTSSAYHARKSRLSGFLTSRQKIHSRLI
jgi:hypothetical protein